MFRRVRVAVVPSVGSAMRMFAPSDDLKKLYNSEFEAAKFPVDIVPSDSATFAKFLFKAAEAKNNYDAILKDLQTIEGASKNLGVFWERTLKVDDIKEFKSLQPATLFTLNWMQANQMLEALPSTTNIFETLLNAHKKRVVARIWLPGPESKFAKEAAAAKEVAKKLHKESANAAHSLDFVLLVDAEFVGGFAVDVQGKFHSTAEGKAEASTTGAAKEVDWTVVPESKPLATKWEDSVETEILRKYLDGLAKFDAEEAKNGV